ncbi:MAG: taurine transporter permease [Myxococcaceae bacterium]|nr:taurine transporter permease [Myxococcaceae bacterium]
MSAGAQAPNKPLSRSALTSAATLRGSALPLALLAVWTLVTQRGWVNPHLIVGPERVVTRLVSELREGELLRQLLASLQRDLLGFFLGAAAGVLVGTAMGLSRLYHRLFAPSFHAAKQVAIFAWIPLMSVWLGSGEQAKVAFIALSAFYPVVIATHQGIRASAREHLEVARAFEFSRWQTFRMVVWPSALPAVLSGFHLGLIYAWLGTIGAEYLLAPGYGVGNVMISGRESLAMDKVLLGIVLVGGVGMSLNALASRLENHLLRWRVSAFERAVPRRQ